MKRFLARHFRRWLGTLEMQVVGDTFRMTPIFKRYTVFKLPKPLAIRLGIHALYLHEFFRSDADRCLHDHPWWFVSIILRGGYWEHTATGRHWRRPGSVLIHRAEFAHRVEIDPDRPKPWSLVLTGPKCRAWGFYARSGWHAWKPGFSPVCETDGHHRQSV